MEIGNQPSAAPGECEDSCFQETGCIFQQPWYLDAVAPGCWHSVRIETDGRLEAYLPFIIRRKASIKAITSPKLTPFLGPWLNVAKGKEVTQRSRRQRLLAELIQQLPQADSYTIPCHPSLTDVSPFYWHGYQLRMQYTYGFAQTDDIESIWQNMEKETRTDIRKAQKQVVVTETQPLSRFIETNRLSFVRQGIEPPYSNDYVERLDEALDSRGRRKILFAMDSVGQVHAVMYLVHDATCVYSLMVGANPQFKSSASDSLLFYEAIKYAVSTGRGFSFCGSMIPRIQRHFQSFGSVQIPNYKVVKRNRKTQLALAFLGRVD